MRSKSTVAAGVLAACFAGAPCAHARKLRRVFEPTDLELEEAGGVELDLQMGFARGRPLGRLVVPDFEFDVGLIRALELDLDGAFSIEDGHDGHPAQAAFDNLWLAAKAGLLDWRDDDGTGWAFGVQAGPKLPAARGARGIGIEGLALFGWHHNGGVVVVNGGGLVDPSSDGGRPCGVEGGVDGSYALDKTARWTLMGALGGIHFLSSDPAQLDITGGVAFAPAEAIELSIIASVGFAAGSDRAALLFGVSPSGHLWGGSH